MLVQHCSSTQNQRDRHCGELDRDSAVDHNEKARFFYVSVLFAGRKKKLNNNVRGMSEWQLARDKSEKLRRADIDGLVFRTRYF